MPREQAALAGKRHAVVRVDGQHLPVGGEGLPTPLLLLEDLAQAEPQVRTLVVGGQELQALVLGGLQLLIAAQGFHQTNLGQVIVRGQGHGLLQAFQSALVPAQTEIDLAHAQMGLDVRGIQQQGLARGGLGARKKLIPLVDLAQQHQQIRRRPGLGAALLQNLSGGFVVLLPHEQAAVVHVAGRVLGMIGH